MNPLKTTIVLLIFVFFSFFGCSSSQRTAELTSPAPTGNLCDLSQQPNLGNIASAIAPNNQFTSNYDTLAQGAWCTFIALNWPAQGTQPTMQGSSAPIGTCTTAPENCPVVWQSWLDSNDVYCSNGQAPGCGASATLLAARATTHRLKAFNPNNSQILDENFQATGFQLPDKNNNVNGNKNPSVILYEIRENPSVVSFLSTFSFNNTTFTLYNNNGQSGLYAAAKVPSNGLPPPAKLPSGMTPTPIDFPPSAFEVKASWYQLTTQDDPAKLGLLTASAQCADNSCGQTGNFTAGLTGFHVLWKTFPKSSWFWATFEFGNFSSPKTYNNAYLTPVLASSTTPFSYVLPGGSAWPFSGSFVPGPPAPSPVVDAAGRANQIYRPLLSKVAKPTLANYKLIGVQVADLDANGNPTLLGNSHVETDVGASVANGKPYSMSSSCITCHYNASIGNVNTGNCPKSSYINRMNIFNPKYVPPPGVNSGFTGSFNNLTPQYTGGSGQGPYISSDFVWSVQKARWNTSQGNGCPSTSN